MSRQIRTSEAGGTSEGPLPGRGRPQSLDVIACDGCGRHFATTDGPGMIAAIETCSCPDCGGRFELVPPTARTGSSKSPGGGTLFADDFRCGAQSHHARPRAAHRNQPKEWDGEAHLHGEHVRSTGTCWSTPTGRLRLGGAERRGARVHQRSRAAHRHIPVRPPHVRDDARLAGEAPTESTGDPAVDEEYGRHLARRAEGRLLDDAAGRGVDPGDVARASLRRRGRAPAEAVRRGRTSRSPVPSSPARRSPRDWSTSAACSSARSSREAANALCRTCPTANSSFSTSADSATASSRSTTE